MKTSYVMISLATAALGLVGAFGLTGCQKSPHVKSAAQAPQYTCPMHPEVVKDVPGACPKCGMTLVEKH